MIGKVDRKRTNIEFRRGIVLVGDLNDEANAGRVVKADLWIDGGPARVRFVILTVERVWRITPKWWQIWKPKPKRLCFYDVAVQDHQERVYSFSAQASRGGGYYGTEPSVSVEYWRSYDIAERTWQECDPVIHLDENIDLLLRTAIRFHRAGAASGYTKRPSVFV